MKPDDACFTAISVFLDRISRGFDLVYEIRVEYEAPTVGGGDPWLSVSDSDAGSEPESSDLLRVVLDDDSFPPSLLLRSCVPIRVNVNESGSVA